KAMSYLLANTFPFRPLPNWCNARADAPQSPPPKQLGFYWIDRLILEMQRIVSRFLPETRGRTTRSNPLLPRLVRSHLTHCSRTPGQPRHRPIFFGKMACRLFLFFGWEIQI